MTYWAKRKQIERLTLDRFYELVLEQDPSYIQSLGEVITTLSCQTIYKLKRQASADVAAEMGGSK